MATLAERVESGVPRLGDRRAVLLPDLFVDLFIPLGARGRFMDEAEAIARRGGGNLVSPGHAFRIGGDAANTAYAMASVGAPCTLIAPVDPIGRALLQTAFEGTPADLSLLQDCERGSSTVALEFDDASGSANVMLSDPGPLESFGPERLDERAWAAIESADVVGVMNWSQNRSRGSELLRAVLPRARRAGAFTYLDTSDPRHRLDAVRDLLQDATIMGNLSAWGMNEQEAAFFGGAATGDEPADIEGAIAALRRVYPGRIDVHTEREAVSASGERVTRVPTAPIRPRFRTGAGDAWNAGNLLGTLLDLDDADRLRVAQGVAALTITAVDRRPPHLAALVHWLRRL